MTDQGAYQTDLDISGLEVEDMEPPSLQFHFIPAIMPVTFFKF